MNSRLPALGLAVFVSFLPCAHPAPARPGEAARFLDLFQPTRTDLATLAPDGSRVAYTFREGDELSVVVIDPADPGRLLARIAVGRDASANTLQTTTQTRAPLRVNWMKWVTPDRLVLETNHVSVSAVGDVRSATAGLISAVDFAGGAPVSRVLVRPADVKEIVLANRVGATRRDRTPLAATVDNDRFHARNREGGSVAGSLFGANGPAAGGSPESFFAAADSVAAVPTTTDESSPTVAEYTTVSRDRSPAIFDLDPAVPGAILARAAGETNTVVYRVDTATGRLTQLIDTPTETDHNYLLDRQGRPRIALPTTVNLPFPHRYELERGAGAARTGDLDAILGFGGARRFEVSPENFFAERTVPLGFGENPAHLYFASNVGRDRYGIYRADLAAGKVEDLAIEHPRVDLIPMPENGFPPGGMLVYDRYTRNLVGVRVRDRLRTTQWLHPALQGVQSGIERAYPGRSVQIVEWDAAARRFLAAVSGPTDAGGFVLYDRQENRLTEFARQAPWLDEKPKNRTLTLDVEVAPGVTLPCQLTLSPTPKVKPMPLVVICPPAPWERVSPDYQAEVQAVAEMGFAVLQFSGRGAWGYGARHRAALHAGYEDATAADLVRIVDSLKQAFALDTRYVGLIGSGHGGLVALRAMELHPDRFRCAIVIDPIVDLRRWLREDYWNTRASAPQMIRASFGSEPHLQADSLRRDAARIAKPLLVFSYPGKAGSWRRTAYLSAKAFAAEVRRPGVQVDFTPLSEDFAAGLALGRAEVFRDIELFLNTHVYNFNVTIGELREVR